MSLLLEALKRAEKAKQKHSSPLPVSTEAGEAQVEPVSAVPELSADSDTTDEVDEFLRQPRPRRDPLFSPDEFPHSDARITTESESAAKSPASPETAQRTAALNRENVETTRQRQRDTREFFAAKTPAPYGNRLLAGGLLLVVLVSAGGLYYYWKMLSGSPSAKFATAPVLPPPKPVIAKVEPVATTGLVTLTSEPQLPRLSAEREVSRPNPAPITRATGTLAPVLPNAPSLSPTTPASPVPAPAPAENIKFNRNSAQNAVTPTLSSAYQSYSAGDFSSALRDYRKVLQNDPRNHDALLGLAAVAISQGKPEAAETVYLRMLELDPKDAMAQAGLISVNGQMDPMQSESRLKTLLAQQPNAAFLNFTLGNLYAGQGRWAEAQQAFFHAYSREADDPDYAYNLAVALDHLAQQKSAADYYQRALTLAEKRTPVFDKTRLQARLRELSH